MRLLMLGGGKGQLSAIKRMKELGFEVVLTDYLKDAPGIKYADKFELISTFDLIGNLEVAKKYDVNGVMTIGTDQPVYTAAYLADKLSLPSTISKDTAYKVTNKKAMKRTFSANKIPTVKYKVIKDNFDNKKISNLNFPVVIKPLDSQGQRGVYKLNTIKDVNKYFNKCLQFSREDEILIEEYYQSDEITISGWVKDSKLYILTVTDRITYENSLNIGICTSHLYPSKYLKSHYQEIKEISEKIIKSFKIKEGPIYFQFLVGKEGIKVNEIASRIGGAYEADFMPLLTGVSILDMQIYSSVGKKIDYDNLLNYNIMSNSKWLTVHLFYANQGKVKEIVNLNQVKEINGLIEIDINYNKGDTIFKIEDATARAGHFIVIAKSERKLKKKVKMVYNKLKILDVNNNNLILKS